MSSKSTNGNSRDLDRKLFRGPRNYTADLWRAGRMFREICYGFTGLRRVQNGVTIFGSARFAPDHRYYQLAYDTAYLLGKAGYPIITGGGPGIMEAANKGAREAGILSVGCNIRLPREQQPNPYLDIQMSFDYFFVRKLMLVKYSRAFILLPGGFGTMDEVFEIGTLMQTGKLNNFPVVVMGRDYWQNLGPFLRDTMIAHGTIDEQDLDLNFARITDDPQEALSIIRAGHGGESAIDA